MKEFFENVFFFNSGQQKRMQISYYQAWQMKFLCTVAQVKEAVNCPLPPPPPPPIKNKLYTAQKYL